VAADPDSRDYACNKEATRDVVFLLQIRTVGHFDPNHLTYENATSADDGEVWVDVDMFDTEEVAKAKAEDRFEEENEDHRFNAIRVDDDFLLEKEWVTSHWRTESVWLRRDEAEAFAKSKAYKFGELGKGCRVYGDCAEGRLASILRLIENKHVEEYLLSNSFRMDYRAHRRAMEKMIGGQVA
jgi:hypothetical protein